jgi:hypothetical protein
LVQNITNCKLITLNNLVDFIITRIIHDQSSNLTFIVTEGQDFSTTEPVLGMAPAVWVPARLPPLRVLQTEALLQCKGDAVQSLCDNLQAGTSQALSLLGWLSPMSV